MQTPLRQFKGIPREVLGRLEKKDLAWERYYDLSAVELGELVRMPKMGKPQHRYVHLLPKLDLAASVQPITRSVLRVRLPAGPGASWDGREQVDCEGALLQHAPVLGHLQLWCSFAAVWLCCTTLRVAFEAGLHARDSIWLAALPVAS